MKVGFDPMAMSIAQFGIVTPILEEEVLEIKATSIGLALVVVLLFGDLILGGHLEILIGGFDHSKIRHLVGDLVDHLGDGLIGEVVLTPINESLIDSIKVAISLQHLEFVKEGIAQDPAKANLLGLTEGGEDVLPGKVVGNIGHLLDEGLGGK